LKSDFSKFTAEDIFAGINKMIKKYPVRVSNPARRGGISFVSNNPRYKKSVRSLDKKAGFSR
jgi:hypothetical protein